MTTLTRAFFFSKKLARGTLNFVFGFFIRNYVSFTCLFVSEFDESVADLILPIALVFFFFLSFFPLFPVPLSLSRSRSLSLSLFTCLGVVSVTK